MTNNSASERTMQGYAFLIFEKSFLAKKGQPWYHKGQIILKFYFWWIANHNWLDFTREKCFHVDIFWIVYSDVIYWLFGGLLLNTFGNILEKLSLTSTQANHFFKKLSNTYPHIKHTGWGKKPKKNKGTGTSFRDPWVRLLNFGIFPRVYRYFSSLRGFL